MKSLYDPDVYVPLKWVDLCEALCKLLDGDSPGAYTLLSSIMIEARASGERNDLIAQGYDPWQADGVIIGRWGRWLGDKAPKMPRRATDRTGGGA